MQPVDVPEQYFALETIIWSKQYFKKCFASSLLIIPVLTSLFISLLLSAALLEHSQTFASRKLSELKSSRNGYLKDLYNLCVGIELPGSPILFEITVSFREPGIVLIAASAVLFSPNFFRKIVTTFVLAS